MDQMPGSRAGHGAEKHHVDLGLDSGPDTTARLLASASSPVSAAKHKTGGAGSVSGPSGPLPFGLQKMSPRLLSRGREAGRLLGTMSKEGRAVF